MDARDMISPALNHRSFVLLTLSSPWLKNIKTETIRMEMTSIFREKAMLCTSENCD
jgi:hypothetical protein